MMNCADVRENISAYADDELSASERRSFEEHISSCPGCRKEMDDMIRIIKLCQSMPLYDLPEGFGDELHEKLTAAASDNGNAVTGVDWQKRKWTTKTFASIAAGILLIFLGGSIVRFGLLSGGLGAKTAEKADLAPAQAGAGGYLAQTAPDSGIGLAIDEGQDSFAEPAEGAAKAMPDTADDGMALSGSEHPAAVPRSFEINRSSSVESRDNGIAVEFTEAETASYKTSELSITAEDPAAALQMITTLAEENNGTAAEDNTVLPSVQESPMDNYGTATGEGDEVQIKLQLVFAETDYWTFAAALNDAFGSANVQTGAFVTEDRTDELNMLIDQSNAYDRHLAELENKSGESDAEEINKLRKEKEDTDKQIETLRLNSDFITVTVHINKK
ncbi:MAG: hypothetical protein GX940_04345 [Clostridiaceae bacterium]|nr:hypothetical protein [Clostridiaceae bacterium]